MIEAYMDHASATPVRKGVIEAMLPYFTDLFGNASSGHLEGRKAKEGMEKARNDIADVLTVYPGEIFFTSGGTESDNLAVRGVALAKRDKGRHIITSSVEHAAVIKCCRQLEEEGFEVILINSNPATIMTDPDIADRTYIEPITQEAVEQIIIKERTSKDNGILAILPTIGGQTGLNIAVSIAQRGVLEKYGVELIDAKLEAILKAEDRFLFKKCIEEIGLSMPKGEYVYNLDDAIKAGGDLGYPIIIRPAFSLGGTGEGIAKSIKEQIGESDKGEDKELSEFTNNK